MIAIYNFLNICSLMIDYIFLNDSLYVPNFIDYMFLNNRQYNCLKYTELLQN